MKNNKSALQTALNLLGRRSYSEHELRYRLANKGYCPEEINHVANYLLQRGYLDDTALCKFLAAKYLATSKYGRRMVVEKLKQRGFSTSLIEQALQTCSPFDEFAAALKLASDHFQHKKELKLDQVARYLVYRGFNRQTIIRVWEELAAKNPYR